MFRALVLARRSRLVALLAALVVSVAAVLAVSGFLSNLAFGHGDNARPHEIGENEGYGNSKVTVFFYPQKFYCTDETFDDLDGPGHEGDGLVAARDADEFQHPAMGPPGSPCIVGETASGSLPTIDPAGDPAENAEPIWAILPFFDSNGNGVIDAFDPAIPGAESPGADVQCPEPGLPYTKHRGAFATCATHPHSLHAEPAVGDTAEALIRDSELPAAAIFEAAGLPVPNEAGDIPLPNHSHIIDGTSFESIWWLTIGVRVTDPSIWPDFNGRCPANPQGGEPCLTSVDALRAAQSNGQASPDATSNVWLFFDSHQIDPQPDQADPLP